MPERAVLRYSITASRADHARKFTAPTLKLASKAAGKSSAAQTVTIENNGNAALLAELAGTLPTASKGVNVTGGTCVKALAKGSAWLASGASCTVSVAFAPVTGQKGTVAGALSLTDNHLNLNPATQSIALTVTVAP